MSALYVINVLGVNGSIEAVISDYVALEFVRELNAPGFLRFRVRDKSAAVSTFVINRIVEVWRSNPAFNLAPTREFTGVIRRIAYGIDGDSRAYVEVDAIGLMGILAWRHVAYRAGAFNRSEFVNINTEVIMSTLVERNATSAGTTADGRVRNATDAGGTLSGIGIVSLFEAPQSRGISASISCAWRNLLDVLQTLSSLANTAFDLYRTTGTNFVYRFYPLLGSNRTNTVIFAVERGNMASPVVDDDRLDEATVAIVAGQGEGVSRRVVIETSGTYSVTNRNIETYVDARDVEDNASLTTRGQSILKELTPRVKMSFDVVQAPNAYYGVHYFLGDLVKAQHRGVDYTMKVKRVRVIHRPEGNEDLDVELVNEQ